VEADDPVVVLTDLIGHLATLGAANRQALHQGYQGVSDQHEDEVVEKVETARPQKRLKHQLCFIIIIKILETCYPKVDEAKAHVEDHVVWSFAAAVEVANLATQLFAETRVDTRVAAGSVAHPGESTLETKVTQHRIPSHVECRNQHDEALKNEI